MNNLPQDKINGLIAMMQKGIYDGERSAARRALERLCKKHNVNIEDLINHSSKPVYYEVSNKTEEESRVFAQCVFRFAEPQDEKVRFGDTKRSIYFYCKPEKYMELMAAWSVLKQHYRAEKKVFMHAFFNKNRLNGERPDDAPEPTPEEAAESMRAAIMAEGMTAAHIHKQIGTPSKND